MYRLDIPEAGFWSARFGLSSTKADGFRPSFVFFLSLPIILCATRHAVSSLRFSSPPSLLSPSFLCPFFLFPSLISLRVSSFLFLSYPFFFSSLRFSFVFPFLLISPLLFLVFLLFVSLFILFLEFFLPPSLPHPFNSSLFISKHPSLASPPLSDLHRPSSLSLSFSFSLTSPFHFSPSPPPFSRATHLHNRPSLLATSSDQS